MEIGRLADVSGLIAVTPVSPLTPQERVLQQDLIRAVESVNALHMLGVSTELTFSYDRHARKPVLQIVDRETKEVLRQLPPEYILRLARESAEG